MKKLITVLAVAIIILTLFDNCSMNSQEKNHEAVPTDNHPGELMSRMQYNFTKLGLALRHRNQRLAGFYLDEMNEVYDEIVSKKIMSNGKDLSKLITMILQAKKDNLASAIASNDTARFDEAYHAVVASCNNCHIETNHDFIIIKEPQGEFNGQDFGVKHSLYSE